MATTYMNDIPDHFYLNTENNISVNGNIGSHVTLISGGDIHINGYVESFGTFCAEVGINGKIFGENTRLVSKHSVNVQKVGDNSLIDTCCIYPGLMIGTNCTINIK